MADDEDRRVVRYVPFGALLRGDREQKSLSVSVPLRAQFGVDETAELSDLASLDLSLFEARAGQGHYLIFGNECPGMAPFYAFHGSYISVCFDDLSSYELSRTPAGASSSSHSLSTALIPSSGSRSFSESARKLPYYSLLVPDKGIMEALKWAPDRYDLLLGAYRRINHRADGSFNEGELEFQADRHKVTNNFSNQVFVQHNGVRLTNGQFRRLEHGDVFQLGPITFRYWHVR